MLSFLRPRRERPPEPQPEVEESHIDPEARERLLWELRVRNEGSTNKKGYDPRENPEEIRRLERLAAEADEQEALMKAEAAMTPEQKQARSQQAAGMGKVMRERIASEKARAALGLSAKEYREKEYERRRDKNVGLYAAEKAQSEEREALRSANEKTGEYLETPSRNASRVVKPEVAERTPDAAFKERSVTNQLERARASATAAGKKEMEIEEKIGDLDSPGPAEILEEDDITTEEKQNPRAVSKPAEYDLTDEPFDVPEPDEELRQRYANRAKPKGVRRRELEADPGERRAEKWERISEKLQELRRHMQEDGMPAEQQEAVLNEMNKFLMEAELKSRRLIAARKAAESKDISAAARRRMGIDA